LRGTFAGTKLAQSLVGWLAGTISWLLNLFPKFPILSNVRERTSFCEHPWRAALPAITLTLVIVRQMLSSVIEMARLKGKSLFDVVLSHALPNA
jgi:peptide/nickel transport system permease protein